MQSVLFATKNPAKIKYMQDIVQPLDMIIKGIGDFEVLEIEELGDTPLENAHSKALAYHQVF